jgi:MSHA pilin protein MshD
MLSRRGFTIAEVSVCVVIVGVMLATALQTVGQSGIMQYRIAERTRGAQLARMMMAEIMQQPYQEAGVTTTVLGPESGEARATYDDVDDYNGMDGSPPRNKDDSVMSVPSATTWRRTVTVVWVNPLTLGPAATQIETGAKLITVNVYHKNVLVTKLSAIKSNAP